MKIFVEQKIWTILGSKYIIHINEKKRFIIEKIIFSFNPTYRIIEFSNSKEIGRIVNYSWFKADANIALRRTKYQFKQESLGKMTYSCTINLVEDKFLIQGNFGYHTSVFRNEKQIAYWESKKFVILSGNKYEVNLNFNEDPLLISSFVVLVDNYKNSLRVGGDMGWEIGNLGKGLTEFDINWKPKMNHNK